MRGIVAGEEGRVDQTRGNPVDEVEREREARVDVLSKKCNRCGSESWAGSVTHEERSAGDRYKDCVFCS